MRNKNTIIFLLMVFIGICTYNLYWTYVQFNADGRVDTVTNNLDNLKLTKPNASTWTESDSAIEKAYSALMSDTSFMNKRKKAIDRSFTLGLDLQGGMFVTLEVGVEQMIQKMASNPNDTALLSAIACASAKQAEEAQSFVPLFVDCFKSANPNVPLGAVFSSEELEISVSTPEDEVIDKLNEEETSAIDRTFNILRTRITSFGVVSPNLQKQESTGRILLELPGVKEPERVRQILQSTAELTFYRNHTWREAYPVLLSINDKMRSDAGITLDSDSTDQAEEVGEEAVDGGTDAVDQIPSDSAADDFSTTDDLLSDSTQSDLSIEEQQEKFLRENPLFRLISLPNVNELAQFNSQTPSIGYVLASDTSKMRQLDDVLKEYSALIPDRMRFAWTFKPTTLGRTGSGPEYFQLIAIYDDGEPALSGREVSTARQDFDATNPNEAVVSMNMTVEGAKTWALLTEQNVGKHISVLLDGRVYSFPVINEAITGGRTQISGGFAVEEAKDLANVLKAGQLPVPARIEGEETVGPSLGAENVRSGLVSFIAALIIILIFMAVYYARAGLIANVALLANIIFVLGCSAAFTIVLTLPGIAAVVLTVGMAVDANVLIFERIREEIARGKTLKAGIKSGFSNAFSSVMDANITTFLTGVVLYSVGIGPISGFAVSLMIGIVTSLISALIITRLILDNYANRGKDSLSFGFDWTTGLFDKIKLNMVGRRKTFYMLSGALVAISLISMLTIGFKTGVDFQGGRQFVVEFTDASGSPSPLSSESVQEVRNTLTDVFENNAPTVKTLKYDNQLMVTTSYKVEDRSATSEVTNLLLSSLGENFPDKKLETLSTSDVGPTVANDIRQAAYYSIFFSLLIIFFYILLRFRKWQYSAGAITAVFHDVIIVLGVFSLLSRLDLGFSLEINQSLIAALLTIIGYSINDTVVVFDRIRENIAEMRSVKISDIYNLSIDQTLSRTLITSFTTFLTALIIFVFGGDVIRGFFFAIMLGIIIGTYSSIFVASPIALDLIRRQEPELDEEQTEKKKGKKGKSKSKK